jgi:signal peptidase II
MVWLEAMLAAVLVTLGDQASKAAVLARRPAAAAAAHRPFISIQCMLNARGALGPFVGVPALLALWVAAVVLAMLVLMYGAAGHGVLLPIGIGAVIGGAAGNVLDRVRRGAIVDFIAVGPWPVFNLADAAIVAGIGLALLSLG